MSRLFVTRRAAEEFDRALEGEATPDVSRRYADLTRTVAVLGRVTPVDPRPAFSARLREQLMTAEVTATAPADQDATSPHPRRHTRPTAGRDRVRQRLSGAAAALLVLGAATGTAAAAGAAQPGQSLYPIKRGLEAIATEIRVGDGSRGAAELGQANARMQEIAYLVRQERTEAIPGLAREFSTSAYLGADGLFREYQRTDESTSIVQVRDFVDAQMTEVAGLLSSGSLPAGTERRLAALVDVLSDIDQQARTLCDHCGGPAVRLPVLPDSSASQVSMASLVAMPTTTSDELMSEKKLQRLVVRAEQVAATTPQAPPPSLTSVVTKVPKVAPPEPSTPPVAPQPQRTPPLVTSKLGVEGLVTELGSSVTSTAKGITGVDLSGATGALGEVVKRLEKSTDGLGLPPAR